MAKIGGVAVEQLRREPDAQAKRRRADLGDQLLEGVCLVPEPLAEGAIQTMRRARPMQLLVRRAISAVMKAQIDWIPLEVGSVRPTQGRTLAVMQVSGGSQSFNAVNTLRLLGR